MRFIEVFTQDVEVSIFLHQICSVRRKGNIVKVTLVNNETHVLFTEQYERAKSEAERKANNSTLPPYGS